MKKIIFLLTAIMTAFVCVSSVFAAPIDAEVNNLSVTAQSDTVTVSGSVTPARECKLSYMIVYPGKTQTDVTAENFSETVAAVGEITADAEGSFSTSFLIKDNTPSDTAVDIDTYYPRTYKAYLTLDGFAVYKSVDFQFTGSAYVSQIIKKINGAKTAGDTALMQTLIDNYYEKLYIGNTVYEQKIKTDAEKNTEFIRLFTAMPQISETDFTELEAQFTDAAVTTLVNKAVADEEIAEIISTYATELKLEGTSEYMTYTTIIGDSLKKEVRAYAIGKTFASAQEFADGFKKFTVLRSINGVLGWDNIRQTIEANYAVIGINLGTILSTDSKSEIYGRMVNQNYADYPAVVKGFNTAVTESRKKPTPGSNTPGGGGGGSTGGNMGNSVPAGRVNDNTQEDKYFNDLGGFDWAEKAINNLAEKNIINGRGDNKFEPSSPVSREEFVKMIVLASGKYDESAEADFTDVNKNAWYYRYVASAFKNSIVSGMENGQFGVGQNITREDMAVIIARLMGYNAASEYNAGTFTDDSEISDYAKTAVAFASKMGIIEGADGKFNPKESLTRTEAAVVLSRFMSY